MSLITAPNNILCLGDDSGQIVGSALDIQSQQRAYERCDSLDVGPGGVNIFPYTPSYDKCDVLSATFEDPFQHQSGTEYSTISAGSNFKPNLESKPPSVEMDNKFLGFSSPILKAGIFDDIGQTWPVMSAELYGMFFVAEDVFGETSAKGDELTCYRRNLFQINGAMILSRGMNRIINEHGQLMSIYKLEATLTAFESIEGKSTELISVPWKSASCVSSEEKAGTAPPSLPIDLSLDLESDLSLVSIPISWKRLQFKHATANNGRRKGLQQHYIIQVNLVATLDNGINFQLAEIQSGPIIVRGRSPRNFDSRIKESEKKHDVKANQLPEPSTPTHQSRHDSSSKDYTFTNSSEYLQSFLDDTDCKYNHEQSPTDTQPTSRKRLSVNSAARPSIATNSLKYEDTPLTRFSASPVDPSHSDNEKNQMRKLLSIDGVRKRLSNSITTEITTEGQCMKGLAENTDFLYEYFPLSLDDWIPPVDAIYRPHVVHHTRMPDNLRVEQSKNKRKTYFSAND